MERKQSWPLTDDGMAVIVHEQQGLEVVPLKTFYEISERNVQVYRQTTGQIRVLIFEAKQSWQVGWLPGGPIIPSFQVFSRPEINTSKIFASAGMRNWVELFFNITVNVTASVHDMTVSAQARLPPVQFVKLCFMHTLCWRRLGPKKASRLHHQNSIFSWPALFTMSCVLGTSLGLRDSQGQLFCQSYLESSLLDVTVCSDSASTCAGTGTCCLLDMHMRGFVNPLEWVAIEPYHRCTRKFGIPVSVKAGNAEAVSRKISVSNFWLTL